MGHRLLKAWDGKIKSKALEDQVAMALSGDGNDGGTKIVWFGMAMSPNPGEPIQKKWQIFNTACPTRVNNQKTSITFLKESLPIGTGRM